MSAWFTVRYISVSRCICLLSALNSGFLYAVGIWSGFFISVRIDEYKEVRLSVR